MSFLARWLGWKKPNPRTGLRPHRDVDIAAPYDEAYDRVARGIHDVLGAHLAVDDRRGRFIEAAFGLVNNERIRCTFETPAPDRTVVRIEAFFPAGATIRETSLAVDTLADALAVSSSFT